MMSRTMTEYLETSLTEEQVTSLADQLSIKKMKSNPAVNHADRHAKCVSTFALLLLSWKWPQILPDFLPWIRSCSRGRFLEGESFVRKGEAGGWRQYFTEVFQLDCFQNKYPIIQLLISDISTMILSGNGKGLWFLASKARMWYNFQMGVNTSERELPAKMNNQPITSFNRNVW